jgi:hypothetical protein
LRWKLPFRGLGRLQNSKLSCGFYSRPRKSGNIGNAGPPARCRRAAPLSEKYVTPCTLESLPRRAPPKRPARTATSCSCFSVGNRGLGWCNVNPVPRRCFCHPWRPIRPRSSRILRHHRLTMALKWALKSGGNARSFTPLSQVLMLKALNVGLHRLQKKHQETQRGGHLK